ncbi:MAG: hypothetical protein AAF432_15660 [Planctomycetota bacterium]
MNNMHRTADDGQVVQRRWRIEHSLILLAVTAFLLSWFAYYMWYETREYEAYFATETGISLCRVEERGAPRTVTRTVTVQRVFALDEPSSSELDPIPPAFDQIGLAINVSLFAALAVFFALLGFVVAILAFPLSIVRCAMCGAVCDESQDDQCATCGHAFTTARSESTGTSVWPARYES